MVLPNLPPNRKNLNTILFFNFSNSVEIFENIAVNVFNYFLLNKFGKATGVIKAKDD